MQLTEPRLLVVAGRPVGESPPRWLVIAVDTNADVRPSVFGDRPQLPKPPAERRADASDVHSAARHAQPAVMTNTVKLPKTATDAEIRMITGSILLMLSVLLSLYSRRRALAR